MDDLKTKLVSIVGKENVSDFPEALQAYSHDHSFVLQLKPWFIVKPLNIDEVQRIVMLANQTSTPLVPVSSGPPHFYGDTVPSATGAVVVDLSRMNRILRIDRKNKMTLIEAGVTYGQLQPELAKEGLTLATSPLLPRANKSVIAGLLERQPTMIPKYQWTLMEPLRSLEVVWGNGEVMWTGEAGAGPHSLEQQWESGIAQIGGNGPGGADWYRFVSAAQGSMGIVTWASVKCEVLPQIHKIFFVTAQSLDNLIDCAYKLLRFRLGDELLILNNSSLAYILHQEAEKVRALLDELPPWVIIVGVAGRDILPEERVKVQEKGIRDVAQQYGLPVTSAISGVRDGQVLDIILQPSREPHWKLDYKGGCQDIFFMTTLDRTPEFLKIMYSMAVSLKYPCSDIGVYIQPQQRGANCHCEFSLPFNPSNEAEVVKLKRLFIEASEELLKHGAYFSRPYGIWANMVYNRDVQNTVLLKGIKQILDPNHILNPGKLCF